MPQGKGTYGSQVGRPSKKNESGTKKYIRTSKKSKNTKWERRVY